MRLDTSSLISSEYLDLLDQDEVFHEPHNCLYVTVNPRMFHSEEEVQSLFLHYIRQHLRSAVRREFPTFQSTLLDGVYPIQKLGKIRWYVSQPRPILENELIVLFKFEIERY